MYKNTMGDSGINGYEATQDSIIVYFKNGGIYLYNAIKCGIQNIIKMKELAKIGTGLNEFINKYIKKEWAQKMN